MLVYCLQKVVCGEFQLPRVDGLLTHINIMQDFFLGQYEMVNGFREYTIGLPLIPEHHLFSRRCENLNWGSRADPPPFAKGSSPRIELKAVAKYMRMTSKLQCVL